MAAAQFTILGAFCLAAWWTLLSPIHRAVGQFKLLFSPGYELREFFVWLTVFTLFTVAVGITFWFRKAATRPLASALVVCAGFLLGLSVLWFDAIFIFSCALGLSFAVWSWLRPNIGSERGVRKIGAPPSN